MSRGEVLSAEDQVTVRQVRVLCRVAAAAGGVVSMGANMLASDGTPVGLVAGVVAPGAFILAAEIAARALDLPRARGTSVLRGALAVLLVGIAAAAAPASFNHIRHQLAAHGENELGQVLIAGVVDAVTVMGLVGNHLCSMYLRRHRAAQLAAPKPYTPAAAPSTTPTSADNNPGSGRARRRSASPAKAGRRSVESGSGREKRDRALAVLRDHPGLTNDEVAERAGVSRSTVKNAKADLRATTEVAAGPDHTTTASTIETPTSTTTAPRPETTSAAGAAEAADGELVAAGSALNGHSPTGGTR